MDFTKDKDNDAIKNESIEVSHPRKRSRMDEGVIDLTSED
jgi:hypothetical protein